MYRQAIWQNAGNKILCPGNKKHPWQFTPAARTSTGLFILLTTEKGVLSCKNFAIQFLLWAYIRIRETSSS